MSDWIKSLGPLMTADKVLGFFAALMILLIGLFVARKASHGISKLSHLDSQQQIVLQKISYYLLVTIVVAAALSQLGFDLKVLLGAAGVLTVAIGFAAQTSASNLISGLFLMIDRPFMIGDVIRVDTLTGQVLSIDLLSCKLRTMDNLMVRVPNETMVKSNITNLSMFPIRRIDMQIGVAYKENMDQVKGVCLEVASSNPLCLDEPAPLFIFQGFGDSSVNFQFSVWAAKDNFLTVQNEMYEGIKKAFEAAGIEIPFPHRVVVLPDGSKPSVFGNNRFGSSQNPS